jgi:hypothetical protein
LRISLIASSFLVDAKGPEFSGEAPIQAASTDAEAIAIGGVILPDNISSGRVQSDLRIDLVSGLRAYGCIFRAFRIEYVLRSNRHYLA